MTVIRWPPGLVDHVSVCCFYNSVCCVLVDCHVGTAPFTGCSISLPLTSESEKALLLFLIVPLAVEHYSYSNGTIRNSNGTSFFLTVLMQCSPSSWAASKWWALHRRCEKKSSIGISDCSIGMAIMFNSQWNNQKQNRAFLLSESQW